MSAQIKDSLDDAIDRVAAKLVSVADDPAAVERIVSSLPPRREREWWRMSSLPVQAVAAASLVLAIVYMRSTSNDDLGPRIETQHPSVAVNAPRAEAVADASVTIPQERPQPATAPVRRRRVRSTPEAQQAFGLPAMDAPAQLTIGTLISTAPLDPLEPASVAPILLNDLPLATEVQTPFSKE